ncbi:Xaa-Pro aminopeptidase [Melghirimyces profundicolus]|uniref:Xaa-Pro aminopeptidase n=1 Tax=Melghirimyces profundicolus TaxID=1242148 RepID=A0A2T6C820_9BACL|nr:M24 family metallopeptidase [Melghirimyces profundicolus]PTX64442.1 Xaa-Pro aminopeptidase [Melghirimyces profundicolus]
MKTDAPAEVKERVEGLRRWMEDKELEGVLLRKRRSFAWLTGGRSNHIVQSEENGVADVLVLKDRVICFTTEMEATRIAEEELADLGFEMVVSRWSEGTEHRLAQACRGKRVGSDAPAEGVDSIPFGPGLARLAYVLGPSERARYRELGREAARALEETCMEIRPGMTEHEIAGLLAGKAVSRGMRIPVLLVATDERIHRYRHPIPTGKRLERYAMLVLCAERAGLVANATRFVHFGPLPPDLLENRLKLAEIDLAMNRATRPGVPIREVFLTGIRAYKRAGFPDDWRYLHQGGPTGYASREFLADPESEGVVQLNQAFAWNPSLPGIKSEDTILVRRDENEFLTHTGEWVYIKLTADGQLYRRPDILVR